MGLGWGTVAGWVFDRIGDKKSGLRNRINKIEREMNELQKKPSPSDSDRDRYERLSVELRKAQKQINAL